MFVWHTYIWPGEGNYLICHLALTKVLFTFVGVGEVVLKFKNTVKRPVCLQAQKPTYYNSFFPSLFLTKYPQLYLVRNVLEGLPFREKQSGSEFRQLFEFARFLFFLILTILYQETANLCTVNRFWVVGISFATSCGNHRDGFKIECGQPFLSRFRWLLLLLACFS